MKTLLWVDATRNPIKNNEWTVFSPISRVNATTVWITSFEEFKGWILRNGLPEGISFDFDLGDEAYAMPGFFSISLNKHIREKIIPAYTGFTCAVWLASYCLNLKAELPKWNVHSPNKTQADRIVRILKSYEKHNLKKY